METSDTSVSGSSTIAISPVELKFPESLESQLARYVSVGTAAGLFWEVMSHPVDDYRIIWIHKFSIPTATYLLSRFSTLVFILWRAIFFTAPLGHRCSEYEKSIAWTFPFATCTTYLLFFFRLFALFRNNLIVTSCFFILWISVVASSATVISALVGVNISNSEYCSVVTDAKYLILRSVVPLIDDTLVFLAIGFKLTQISISGDRSVKSFIQTFVSGAYLPRLARSMLKEGQAYYLVAVTSNIVALAILCTSLPMSHRLMGALPNLALTNIMACSVFRNLKLGKWDEGLTAATIPLSFGPFPTPRNPEAVDMSTTSRDEGKTVSDV